MAANATVVISRRGIERWRAGNPWIYQSDVERSPAPLSGGEVVRVTEGNGRFLGQAFFSRESKITLRWCSWVEEPVDGAFFKARIAAADALRQRAYPAETTYRVVHGEADLLPGLVVDRFGDCLSVQLLTKATEHRKQLIVDALVEHFKPRAIVNRSDTSVRKLEGLEPEKGMLYGSPPGLLTYKEGDVTLEVDLMEGQKTGAFLDQRDNHVLASQWGEGEALDCFSYVGGFALQLAKKAKQVTAVEISEPACAQIRANAKRNALSNVEAVAANAFDWLRDALAQDRKFDTIVIDPPSFAKNKQSIEPAVRGYKELNLRAMQLLRPGGVLITASCTYHVAEERFEELLESAAADAKRRVQLVERRGAGKDHPVLLGLRETRYLKCYVLRVV